MFNSHLVSFFDYLEYEKKYSKHTLDAYKRDISDFFTYYSPDNTQLEISEINYQIIRAWIATLFEAKQSSKTINRKLSSLKSLFKFLLRNQEITVNPMSKISGPKNTKRLPEFIEESKSMSKNVRTFLFVSRYKGQVLFNDGVDF